MEGDRANHAAHGTEKDRKSSVSADLSSYHDGALPGGSARPRNRHGSTSILGRVAVCIDGTYCVSVFASRTDLSSDDLGRVTLLSPSQHFNYKFRSQSQRGASQKHKETITVDSNPVMHVARGDRQSIISGRERSQLTSADSAKASRMCQSGRNDCGDPGRHWVHGNNIHIDADSLIRHNRELLRLAAHARARSPLHLQNIIAWWQHNAIPSIFIRSNARDFFFCRRRSR
jgi:hypothetical protein